MLTGRSVGQGPLDALRLVHPARRRSDRLRGGAGGREDAGGRPVRARHQRAPARDARGPAGDGRAREAARLGVGPRPRDRRRARAPHPKERPADGRGDDPLLRRPRQHRRLRRGRAGPGAPHLHGRAEARREAPDRQVPLLRLVEQAHDAGRPRPGRSGDGRGRAHRLGQAARRAARLPRRLLGPRGRPNRRRRRAAAGRSLRALPHPPVRRPSRAPRDPREGPDRPRVRRPRLLGHRVLRASGADLHRPEGRRRRAAMAALDPSGGARPRQAARPAGRRVPVAHDPRRGMLGLLARRAPARSTSRRTSPTR